MDSDNDDTHRGEVEPLLFGKGNLDLTDPPEEAEEPDEEGSKTEEQSSTKGYGSIGTPPPPEPKSSLWTIQTPVTSREEAEEVEGAPTEDIWAEKNETIKEDEENPFYEKEETPLHERPGKPEKPKRHCIVAMFYTIESFAMITNLILLVSQVLPLVLVSWETSDPAYIALKIYLCVFAIIFTLVEFDRVPFLQKSAFLRTFATRGFMYTFFGLVCFDEAGSDKAYKELEYRSSESTDIFRVSWFALINEIAAISLIAMGVLYFLMGIVCLQRVRTKYVYDDRKKWKDYREALERWEYGV